MRIELQDGDWYEIEPSGERNDDGNEMLAVCVFEGSRGQYIYHDIIQLAVQHGFRLSVQADTDIRIARNQSVTAQVTATDAVVELADKAEEYLNDQVAPEGWGFCWSDGEYFFGNEAWYSYEG